AKNDRDTAFPIVVYRSTAPGWKQGQRIPVAGLAIRGADAANGNHKVVVNPNLASKYVFSSRQPDALRPDLKYDYVLAAADGAGLLDAKNKTNPPTASFQIHVITVIAHGYSTDLHAAQAENKRYASELQAGGYEKAIAWNWNANNRIIPAGVVPKITPP